jgi:hypothetical protein
MAHAYFNSKKQNGSSKSKGLGTTIEKVTTATGIKRVVQAGAKALGKEDCGCGKRRDFLNNPNLAVNKIFYKNKK